MSSDKIGLCLFRLYLEGVCGAGAISPGDSNRNYATGQEDLDDMTDDALARLDGAIKDE